MTIILASVVMSSVIILGLILTVVSVVMPSGVMILTIVNPVLIIPPMMMSIAAGTHLLPRTTKTLVLDALIILVFGLFDLDCISFQVAFN